MEEKEIIEGPREKYFIQKKGLWDSLKDTQKSTAVVIQWMEWIADLIEKIRNLVQW